ncbi:MAG: apolipoprotein N-acyltransferase [Candidatus Eisenbacteria bacterium]
MPRPSAPRAWATALTSGVLLALAFPPIDLAPLAWIGLVPAGLWLASEEHGRRRSPREAWGLGYALGLVFFGIGLHWIAFLSKVAVTVSWIMYPAWFAAAAYLALYPALAAALAALARRRLGLPIAIGWPLFWLASEWLRAQGELGFPWLHLGYSQWNVLAVLQLATLSGVSGVSLFVAALNGLVLGALTLGGRARMACAAAALALVALPFAWYGPRIPPAHPAGPALGLIQGNVPGSVKWSGKHEDDVLAKFMVLSRQAIADGARFVIWPETSTGSYLRQNLDQRMRLQDFVDSTEVAILTGYPDYRFTGPKTALSWNAAGVFWPHTGLGPQYAKMHLVPFGEKMPFEWLIPAIGRLDLGQAEWTPGADPSPLPTPFGPAGVLVCFESIFSDPARAEVLRGATWLVVLTNDEWFGKSGALAQHAEMSVFRAVEHRVPLARCANTGLTFLVDPWGRKTAAPPIFEDAVVVLPLPAPAHQRTPFTRLGDLAGPLLAGIAGLVFALSLGRRRAP